MSEIAINYDVKIYEKNPKEALLRDGVKHNVEILHKKLKFPNNLRKDIIAKTIEVHKIIKNESSAYKKPRNLVAIVAYVRMNQHGINISINNMAEAAGINPHVIRGFLLQMKNYIRLK
ncbi:MAG: hypothetical protein ACP6IY_22240 [Promethearchaeia archaeon]